MTAMTAIMRDHGDFFFLLRFLRSSVFQRFLCLSALSAQVRGKKSCLVLANCQLLFANCWQLLFAGCFLLFPPRLCQVHKVASHVGGAQRAGERSEEHTSELQS